MISQRESSLISVRQQVHQVLHTLLASDHRLPRCLHLVRPLGPGLGKDGLNLVQLDDLRAELLVDDPSFNVVTASAKDKEIRTRRFLQTLLR